MAKIKIESNPRVTAILDDLEEFKKTCVEYGYVYNEAMLYNMEAFPYRQHTRLLSGKTPRDCWADDAQRYATEMNRISQY